MRHDAEGPRSQSRCDHRASANPGCETRRTVRKFAPLTRQSIVGASEAATLVQASEAAMTRHPKERPDPQGGLSRREVLKRSAAASLLLPGAAAVLDACSKPGTTPSGGGSHANGPGTGSYW